MIECLTGLLTGEQTCYILLQLDMCSLPHRHVFGCGTADAQAVQVSSFLLKLELHMKR